MLMTLTPLHSPITSIAEKVNEYANHSRADNTVKAYRSDWKHFTNWCTAQNLNVLPATSSTVALHITALAGHAINTSTIQRRLTAIFQAHQMAGHESPTTSEAGRTVMKGIRRVHGTAQVGKAPVMTEDVRKMVSTLPDTLIGVRERALLLIGFAGAFRRSELVGLDVSDIAFTREGVVVTLRRSKTDQDGQGRKLGIPYGSHPHTCPVRALQAWLDVSGITESALFRSVNRHGQLQPGRLSDKAVALVVKRVLALPVWTLTNTRGIVSEQVLLHQPLLQASVRGQSWRRRGIGA